MQIKIAPFTSERRRYFVIYPAPTPSLPPHWVVLDARGRPLGGQTSPELDDELRKAADYAALWAPAALLEEYLDIVTPPAIEKMEELGWVARTGADREDVIFPDTRVWFPAGVPADLPLKVGVDVKRALRLVADAVRDGQAMPVGPDTFPSRGMVISANWLAYWA